MTPLQKVIIAFIVVIILVIIGLLVWYFTNKSSITVETPNSKTAVTLSTPGDVSKITTQPADKSQPPMTATLATPDPKTTVVVPTPGDVTTITTEPEVPPLSAFSIPPNPFAGVTPPPLVVPPPPDLNCILAGFPATDYYNNESMFKGKFTMVPLTFSKVNGTTCDIGYSFASVGTPTVVAGKDRRRFSFLWDGLKWAVSAMGPHDSGVTTTAV